MKVLFYTDLHVSYRNMDYMRFLEETIQYLEELVKTHAPDFLVNLGDTLDTFGTLDVRDGAKAQEYLLRLSQFTPHGIQHIVLRGNHDTADKLGDLSSTGIIAPPVVTYVSQPTLLEHTGFLCVPHTKDLETARKFIEENAKNCVAILAHTDWLGCRLTPAYVSKDGLDPAQDYGVPVFAGHYHAPAVVGKVHFVGSPLYHDFRDLVVEEPRGFLLWDGGSDFRRIPNPHTYRCVRIEAKTKKSLQKSCDENLPEAERLRVKVYVPKKLIEDAQDLFKGFLWYGVYPLEGEKEGIEFAAKVTLRTTPEEAVKKAAGAAGEEFNKTVLEQYGLAAFKGDS